MKQTRAFFVDGSSAVYDCWFKMHDQSRGKTCMAGMWQYSASSSSSPPWEFEGRGYPQRIEKLNWSGPVYDNYDEGSWRSNRRPAWDDEPLSEAQLNPPPRPIPEGVTREELDRALAFLEGLLPSDPSAIPGLDLETRKALFAGITTLDSLVNKELSRRRAQVWYYSPELAHKAEDVMSEENRGRCFREAQACPLCGKKCLIPPDAELASWPCVSSEDPRLRIEWAWSRDYMFDGGLDIERLEYLGEKSFSLEKIAGIFCPQVVHYKRWKLRWDGKLYPPGEMFKPIDAL